MIEIFAEVLQEIIANCENDGRKVTQQELADVLEIRRSGMHNKIVRDGFFIDDVVKICNYLGFKVLITDGEKEYEIK